MPGLLATARVVLAVRKAVHAALVGFTMAGISVCLIWAALLAGGRTFTLPLVGLLCIAAALAGAATGLLKVISYAPGKVAAYVDWRLEAGGAVMAAVEHGGRFVGPAQEKLTAAAACATPFLPRWASLAFLPVALALLLAGSSSGKARPLGFLVEFGAGGGGEGGSLRAEQAGPGTRLVLFRTRPSHSESARRADLEGLPRGTAKGSIPARVSRPETGADAAGDTTGEEMSGGGTSATAKGAGVTPAGKGPGQIDAYIGSLSPEWISTGRRYSQHLLEDE